MLCVDARMGEKMYIRWFALATFMIGLAVFTLAAHATDNEAQAKAAEQAGKYREALNLYVAALQSATEGSAIDFELREKIIAVTLKVKPVPVVSEEARRFAIRGQTAAREAKGEADFSEAAREFAKALRLAPWWAESYFNLAVAQEKAGQFAAAIRSLKLYLLAAPDATDSGKVKDQIYALEYRQEKARKEARDRADEVRQANEQSTRQQISLSSLSGMWQLYDHHWQLKATGANEFEFVPVWIAFPELGGKRETITKATSGYFVGSIQGAKLSGTRYAASDSCPGSTSFTGEIEQQGSQIVFRYTPHVVYGSTGGTDSHGFTRMGCVSNSSVIELRFIREK